MQFSIVWSHVNCSTYAIQTREILPLFPVSHLNKKSFFSSFMEACSSLFSSSLNFHLFNSSIFLSWIMVKVLGLGSPSARFITPFFLYGLTVWRHTFHIGKAGHQPICRPSSYWIVQRVCNSRWHTCTRPLEKRSVGYLGTKHQCFSSELSGFF